MSETDEAPIKSLVDASTWPNGPFRADAPITAFYGAGFASRLLTALDETGISQSDVQRATGVARSTLNEVLSGRRMPSGQVIAKLEHFIGRSLWPHADQIGL